MAHCGVPSGEAAGDGEPDVVAMDSVATIGGVGHEAVPPGLVPFVDSEIRLDALGDGEGKGNSVVGPELVRRECWRDQICDSVA